MRRYLDLAEIELNVEMGRKIEYWLPPLREADYTILNWLGLSKTKNGKYRITKWQVFDDGHPGYIDVYSFEVVDPDRDGEDYVEYDSLKESLDFLEKEYGVSMHKFVNAGMIQEIYRDYLSENEV